MYRSFLFFFFTIITGRALRRLSMRTACTYAGYMQRRKRILWPEGSSQLSNYLARKKEEGDSRNVCYWPCLLQVLSSNRLCRRFSLLPFFLFFFPFFLFFSFSPFFFTSTETQASGIFARNGAHHFVVQFAIRSFGKFYAWTFNGTLFNTHIV